MKNTLSILFSILIITCELAAQTQNFNIPLYPWTETVSSKKIDQFTQERNLSTEQTLQKNPDFKKMQTYYKERIIQNQAIAKTKATIRKNFAYNNYTDDKNPQGVYRRVEKSLYEKAKESGDFSNLPWETIIDLDLALATIKFPKEVTDPAASNWSCDYNEEIKEQTRCLVGFSQSGGDRNIYYEFDMLKKIWVSQNSFNFEILGRSRFKWLDQNTIVVSLDGQAYHNAQNPSAPITQEQAIKMGLLTPTGYPSRFYVWRRGEAFSTKNLIYQASPDKRSVFFGWGIKLSKDFSPEKILTVFESVDGLNYNLSLLHDLMGTGRYTRTLVNLPEKQELTGFTDNSEIIFKTKMDWLGFKNQDILSIQYNFDGNTLTFSKPKLVYRLEDKSSVLRGASLSTNEEYDPADDKIFITLSKNVSESIIILNRQGDSWSAQQFKDPLDLKYKTLSMWVDDDDKTLHLSVESFLNPATEYLVTSENNEFKFKIIDKSVSAFDESKFSVEQLWIDQGLDQNGKSIKVPYYIVFDPRKVKLNGNKAPAPTLMYGYGGFRHGLMPSYMGSQGKVWLEKGGVYILANIRGGNEFGSYWHESALKENRKNTYNDFIGIAEDLIRRGITSPEKLSIQGGSNGGLLVGVAMTMRPDLFKAVICEVPLLDMSQYHKLSMGSSWMNEYGNPETTEKEFWKRYSPLHQLKKNINYPAVFLKTKRNDDRVHPAHARKFSLRLEELGAQHLYYEDLKGGHGGTALTSDDSAFRTTMNYIFLYDQLGMKF